MIVKKENQNDLINKQMKTINELQDKVKLLQFDISDNLKQISELKRNKKERNKTVIIVRNELIEMKNKNDFSNIDSVIRILRETNVDEQ